ncbi:MAG: hypothetical protein FWB85_08345 [Chitinispirillia bacterium]|nr:hypothetical protein [Chitinispirillia bacterium]MCL2241746.1 hypothetical protein [Chitinispirillia bacterium]
MLLASMLTAPAVQKDTAGFREYWSKYDLRDYPPVPLHAAILHLLNDR